MELTTTNVKEQFASIVKQIIASQNRTTTGIGKALVMCVYASIVLKDTSLTNDLLKCLRKSMKQSAIKDFIEAYGNVAMTLKDGAQYFDAKKEWTPEYKKEVIKASLTWESFKVAKEPDAIDIEAKLIKLLKDVESAKAKNREVKGEALTEGITSALATFHAACMSL